MNKINAVVKIYFTDKFSWFYLPWIILFSSFIVNLIISTFTIEPLFTGGLSSIYIYMLVAGILVLFQNFPFAIGLSIRRKDFFIGTTMAIMIVSLVTGIILFLLSFFENKIIVGWGTDLYFFNIPYFNDGFAVEQIVVNIGTMINLFFMGYAISSIYRRFGTIGMYTFFILLGMLLTACGFILTRLELWKHIGEWFADHTMFQVVLWSIPLTIAYAFVSYSLMRRSTV